MAGVNLAGIARQHKPYGAICSGGATFIVELPQEDELIRSTPHEQPAGSWAAAGQFHLRRRLPNHQRPSRKRSLELIADCGLRVETAEEVTLPPLRLGPVVLKKSAID